MPGRLGTLIRRRQLVEAAFGVIVERGAEATRLSDIAERADVASSLVSYYFPNQDELLLEATRFGIDRFFARQTEALARVDDPLERLEMAIRWAIPDDPRDPERIILLEFWTRAIRRTPMQTVAALLHARGRTLYASIIEAGTASGRFAPVAPAEMIATGIVAMIDGLALRVCLHDPDIDPASMAGLVTATARLSLGIADASPA